MLQRNRDLHRPAVGLGRPGRFVRRPSRPDRRDRRTRSGRALAAVLLSAILVAGCGSGGDVKVFGNPGSTLGVKAGATFAVSLPENQSVGFTWQLAGKPSGDAIETAGDAYSSDNPDKTGSGGQHRFVFRARRAGRSAIRLSHFFRGKPQERRVITVEVR